MKLSSLVNYFIPKKHREDEELSRKSKLIIWFVFITSSIGLFFSGLIYLQNPGDLLNLLAGLVYIPLFLFGLLHFRKYGSFIFSSHFFCGTFFLAMCFMPSSTGGIFSPDMPTIYILPIFALIIGNSRIGLFYAFLTLVVFIVYYYLGATSPAYYLSLSTILTADYFFFNLALNFIVIAFLVFRNENLRLKILGQLKERNELISHKSKEITDSINYAKRIQTAILPEDNTVKNHFPDSFILYLPKDIVSGDFYWVAEKDGFQFIAVADCTGHGVPGALMSVIGVNQLNDIVHEKDILDPAQILQKLDLGVNKILKQNNDDINDGMDIAILKINRDAKTLEYAGAHRPLYYIRNKELTEIKATKFAIGGAALNKEKSFALTQLQMQAGDMVYLSSDGYADQFGSEKNKKITTKKFKTMLESIAEQQLPEQEKYLHEFFLTFKTGYEQTDDVLVAGLRF